MRTGLNSKRSRNNRSNVRRGPNQHGARAVDSTGPEIKIRGSASQIFEKYLALARDATVSGDRVMAENYLQHAEHYYRILNPNAGDERSQPQPPNAVAASPGDVKEEGDVGSQEQAEQAQP